MHHAWLLALLLGPLAMPAMAGTGYKCVDAKGHVSFQDTPCARGERQTVLHLSTANALAPVAAPAPDLPVAPPAPASAPPPPETAVARTPPPMLYRCTPATGGAAYLSRTGDPQPYLAPFAMLGGVTVPLATEYGAAQGANVGMSAPELMSRPTPAMVGSQYVWVRDACYALPPTAACAALDQLDDANDTALATALPDQRDALRAERTRLRVEMAGCQE